MTNVNNKMIRIIGLEWSEMLSHKMTNIVF